MKKQIFILLLAGVLIGCANRGVGPQGGPKDSIPPMPLFSEPEISSVNFTGNRIEVTFDEYIQLDNIASNLLMSPPQQNPPDVKARGKKLLVLFKDSLRENTTYTIDFGAAVCDYHEKVPLRGFSFCFATGPEIDTLEYFGRVYDAATLNPIPGVLVGIHNDLSDTAFVKHPFLRIAKTDSTGYFRIGNIHPGTYRLYAVDDISRDYRLTIGEAYAFASEPIVVSVPVDSSSNQLSAISDQSSAPLLLFKEELQKLYLQRTLREQQHRVQILFSASPDSLPEIRALNDTVHYYTQYSHKGDTVTLWLTDSATIRQDSLFFEVRYRQTDSLYHLEWVTDTLRAIWRAPKLTAKALEAQERRNRNRRLELTTNARKGFDLYDTLRINCSTPLDSIDRQAFHLYIVEDTVHRIVPFEWMPCDSMPMSLSLLAAWKEGGTYELKIDSGAMRDVYGVTHIAANYSLQLKTQADYSTLRVRLNPYIHNARIQLLNSKDQVVRELPASEQGAFFQHLQPDTYYLRLYLDENGDGKWTPGYWDEQRQPEPVYYYPEKIQTKSNWDFEEEWNYLAVPQMESKPRELIKIQPLNKK
ncbi:MAG: Ig-like domain-containing protein [Paludibacteraceae bacterium]|nr:Ig-like domain-containing protein [Paludibacteraceae bacterium]